MRRSLVLILINISFVGFGQELYPRFQWSQSTDTIAYSRAIESYLRDDYGACISALKRLPANTFAQAATHRLLALCQVGLGNFQSAIETFTRAIAYDSTAIGLYYDRAFSYIYSEKYADAIPDLKKFLRYFPGEKQVAVNLAYCYYEAERISEAIEYLENFPGVEKDTTLANTLGWYYIENGQHDKAMFLLEPLLQQYEKFADGYETLSVAFSGLGYTPEAIQAVNILIQLMPDYGRAYYLKGAYLEEAYREEEAEEAFRMARRLGYSWEEY